MSLVIKPNAFLACTSALLCEHYLSLHTHEGEPQWQACLCTVSLSDAKHSWLDQEVEILSTRIL